MLYICIGIAALGFAAYTLLAYKMGWWPYSEEYSKEAAPDSSAYESLARLGIPAPNINSREPTLKGVLVMSPVVVPGSVLDNIDAALTELFRRYAIAYPGWSKAKTHSDYKVLFVEPMATNVANEPGSPAIKVLGQQAAGTCIGDPFPLDYIVLPHQEGQKWAYREYLFHTIFNEGEHFIESHNDRDVFDRYTGLNDSHPHVP